MADYIGCVETAKLLRKALKAKFPGVKFSVKSAQYSGGASIDVDWLDGPTTKMVDAVAQPFGGSGFDGMIDLKYSKDAFLLPDGTATFAQTSGTAGSMGVVEADKVFMPVPGAKRVRFGADYVFTKRRYSRAFLDRALASYRAKYGDDMAANITIKDGWNGDAYADMGAMPFGYDQWWRDAVAKRVGVMKAA